MEESTVTPEPKSENPANERLKKKKKNPVVKFLLGIVYFILIIVLILALWLGVNFCIRADISDSVPDGFSVHLRTDSVWDSVNPFFDLQAADILFSEPGLASVKPVLIDFRQSGLRTNKLVNVALSRHLDFMLYENNEFVAVLDTGILSGIVKLAPFYLKFKPVENLSIIKNDDAEYFEYGVGDTVFYAMIRKNLVIASSSKELFEKVVAGGNSQTLSEAKKESFSGKLTSSFAVTADSLKVLNMFGTDNDYIKAVASCLPEEELATVDFELADNFKDVLVPTLAIGTFI